MRTFSRLRCKKTTHFGSLLRVAFTLFLINTASITKAYSDGPKVANLQLPAGEIPSKIGYDCHIGIVRQTTLRRSPDCAIITVPYVLPRSGAGSSMSRNSNVHLDKLIGICTPYIEKQKIWVTGYSATNCNMLLTCSVAPVFPPFRRTMKNGDLSI